MNKLIGIIRILIIFILLMSCSAADKYLGINEDLIAEEEEEEDDDDDGGGGTSNYYSSNAEAASDGILVYWKMNETSGGTAYDAMGIQNGTCVVADIASGKFGNSRYFNGTTSSYINITGLNYALDVDFTFSFWLYSVSCTGLSYRHPFYGSEIYISINTSGLMYSWDSAYESLSYDIDNGGFGNYSWAHVVVVIDGNTATNTGTVNLYINGELRGIPTATFNANRNIPNATTYLGYGFYGRIDDYAIWNRCLSAAEIQNIYNTNAPLTP